ncbi:MAG TPA: hypothetical protein DEA68_03025 [Verrucomicrobiales bacterium]|nr:hypothetical protein [Verrucomicrobiales bacterium]
MSVGGVCAICGADLAGDSKQARRVVAAVAEFAASIGIDEGAICTACAGGAVPSPCVSRCSLDAAKVRCRSCGRTLDQIQAWSSMSIAERCRVRLRLRGGSGAGGEPRVR